MAVPKAKTSRSRQRQRRSHDKVSFARLVPCKNCGNDYIPHNLCASCGHYDGRQVIVTKTERSLRKAESEAA